MAKEKVDQSLFAQLAHDVPLDDVPDYDRGPRLVKLICIETLKIGLLLGLVFCISLWCVLLHIPSRGGWLTWYFWATVTLSALVPIILVLLLLHDLNAV